MTWATVSILEDIQDLPIGATYVCVRNAFNDSLDGLPATINKLYILSSNTDSILSKTTRLPKYLTHFSIWQYYTVDISHLLSEAKHLRTLRIENGCMHSLKSAITVTNLYIYNSHSALQIELEELLPPNLTKLFVHDTIINLTKIPSNIMHLNIINTYMLNTSYTTFYYLIYCSNILKKYWNYYEKRARINEYNKVARQSSLFDNL